MHMSTNTGPSEQGCHHGGYARRHHEDSRVVDTKNDGLSTYLCADRRTENTRSCRV